PGPPCELIPLEIVMCRYSQWLCAAVCLVAVAFSPNAFAAEEPFTRTEDVIYGRKFGTALTLDVIAPKESANGAAIVWAVSGGWFSAHESISPAFVGEYLKR